MKGKCINASLRIQSPNSYGNLMMFVEETKFCSYIAEDDENFLLITPDPNKIYSAKVLMNVKLKDIEVVVDKSSSKRLVIMYIGKV